MNDPVTDFAELEKFLKDDMSIGDPLKQASPLNLYPYDVVKGRSTSAFLLMMGTMIAAIGLLLLALTWNHFYLEKRSARKVMVGPVDVGGRSVKEMRRALTDFISDLRRQRVVVLSSEGEFNLVHSQILPAFDVESTLLDIEHYSRTHDFKHNVTTRFRSLFSFHHVGIPFWFDEKRLVSTVTKQIPGLEAKLPQDATVKVVDRRFVAIEGRDGVGFDEDDVVKQYAVMLNRLRLKDLSVDVHHKEADIDLEMANWARRNAQRLIQRILIMVYSYDGYNYDTWRLPLREVRDWVEFRKTKELGNFNLYPVLNSEKLRQHLNVRIAKYLYLPKEDIVVRSQDGQPVIDGIAKDGYYLDVARSVATINDSLRFERLDTSNNYTVPLQVAHLAGVVSNPDNEFNLSDVLATGVTDFFGSPENRKFNIKHASQRFQNIILQPGEKFSFIRYMGKVDSANGYMKELVIVNGDSSEPQYGGGICQVSSTLFRTVFFSGLRILNRVNHSFEVKYYRPVGLDATVFDPYPDLKFQNDTEYPVLIQNFVDIRRTKMYFKLIGKKDGRKVRYEGPTYEGIVGEKKEHYKYSWVRHVELPDGSQRKDKFGSVYRNKELVKQYQPDNLLVMKDSVFVPVSLDTTKLGPASGNGDINN